MIMINSFTLCRDDFDDLDRLERLLLLASRDEIRKNFFYTVSSVEIEHFQCYNLIAGERYRVSDIIIYHEPFDGGSKSLCVFIQPNSTLIYRREFDDIDISLVKGIS